jgi:hypothetical protein
MVRHLSTLFFCLFQLILKKRLGRLTSKALKIPPKPLKSESEMLVFLVVKIFLGFSGTRLKSDRQVLKNLVWLSNKANNFKVYTL